MVLDLFSPRRVTHCLGRSQHTPVTTPAYGRQRYYIVKKPCEDATGVMVVYGHHTIYVRATPLSSNCIYHTKQADRLMIAGVVHKPISTSNTLDTSPQMCSLSFISTLYPAHSHPWHTFPQSGHHEQGVLWTSASHWKRKFWQRRKHKSFHFTSDPQYTIQAMVVRGVVQGCSCVAGWRCSEKMTKLQWSFKVLKKTTQVQAKLMTNSPAPVFTVLSMSGPVCDVGVLPDTRNQSNWSFCDCVK